MRKSDLWFYSYILKFSISKLIIWFGCQDWMFESWVRVLIHSYDILGVGMLWKPKDLHKIR
jgi:hypothetical protein